MDDINFYTKGEEIANAITHGIGTLLAIAAAVLLIVFSSQSHDTYKIVGFTIFGIALIELYLGSTLYHSITNKKAKKIFRIIDHSSIYFLIAGTYTPFTLTVLRPTVGWWIFGVVWGLTIVGIVLKAVWFEKLDKVATLLYNVMGWSIIFAIKYLVAAIATPGIVLLVAGGLFYSLGCIFFIKDNWSYNHAIWHLFVIAGSVCHFFCILLYI